MPSLPRDSAPALWVSARNATFGRPSSSAKEIQIFNPFLFSALISSNFSGCVFWPQDYQSADSKVKAITPFTDLVAIMIDSVFFRCNPIDRSDQGSHQEIFSNEEELIE